MFSSKFHLQCARLGAKVSTGLLATLLVLGLCAGIADPVKAQDLRVKAEAEGNLMMYATFTAADSKTLLDGFKQLYPKIDVAYYRSNDSALMERFLSENRAGQNLCDVMVTTSFYGHNIKKRGLFAAYDSPERKFFRDGYKDPQATWTFDLYELWRVRLQHPRGAEGERTKVFQRFAEARVEGTDHHGKPRL